MIAVLDSGGVSALAPTSERSRARLRALRERVDDLAMPSAVLAEGVLTGHPGRDHHVRRLLELVDIGVVGADLGYAAGRLRSEANRAGTDPPPSGVDAIVVGFADARANTEGVVIVTSCLGDILALAVHAENTSRLAVQSV